MADDKSAKDDDKKTDDKGDDNLGDAGKRALERERQARRDAEARLRELEPLAAKAKELEDAKKSGEQKLTEEIRALKDDLAQERQQALIAKVAGERGIPTRLWGRLKGTTRQELEADADDLLESFPSKETADKNGQTDNKQQDDGDDRKDRGDPGRRPKEKLRSGSVTDDDDKDDDFDPDKVAELVRRRRF